MKRAWSSPFCCFVLFSDLRRPPLGRHRNTRKRLPNEKNNECSRDGNEWACTDTRFLSTDEGKSGAKVIGIEKGPDLGYRSGEFGTFGSEIHRQLGIEQPETQEVVDELMRAMGNHPNAQLLNYWIANSGPDLDWYVGTVEHELLTCDSDSPTDPEAPYILPERFPVNDNYDWRKEN